MSGLRISLFWRLFGWFWVAMLSVMLTTLLGLLLLFSPLDFLPERGAMLERLQRHAERLEQAPDRMQRGLVGRGQFLLDATGRPVASRRPVPPELQAFDRRHAGRDQPVVEVEGRLLLIGPQPVRRGGEVLHLYLMRPVPGNPLARLGEVLLGHPLVVLFAIAVSALACLLLAGALLRPVRAIRDGVDRLATAELHQRIDGPVLGRSDELGDLARAFNGMADSLEQFVEGQRRLLRHVSHELRTPLTRLQLVLGIARQKASDVPEAEFDRIECEAARMDQMLGQALQWSRLDAGLAQEPLEVVELAELLRELLADLQVELDVAGLRCRIDVEQACCLPVRPALVRTAVENLLRNAVRHAPPGSTLQIRLGVVDAQAHIDVIDQGAGVPPAELQKLQEPFYRSERDRGDAAGSGMGLAIVQGIARLHGGQLELSNLNPGFRARLRMPLR